MIWLNIRQTDRGGDRSNSDSVPGADESRKAAPREHLISSRPCPLGSPLPCSSWFMVVPCLSRLKKAAIRYCRFYPRRREGEIGFNAASRFRPDFVSAAPSPSMAEIMKQ